MISLIKAEFKKVFKKKAIYIMLLVALGFALLVNVIYKFAFNYNNYYDNYYTTKENRKMVENDLKALNPNNPSDVDIYISLKTELFLFDYCGDNESWRCDLIQENHYSLINSYMDSLYNPKTTYNKAELKKELDDAINKLNNSTQIDIYKENKTKAEKDLAELEKTKQNSQNKLELKSLENQLVTARNDVIYYTLLIDNKVSEENDNLYLKDEIFGYIEAKKSVEFNALKESLNEEETHQNQELKQQMVTNKYNIDHKINPSDSNVSGIMASFIDDFSFIIIIFVIIISGGIMADEYHKGTIKQLLIKPYTRSQILTSKLLVVLMLIPIFTVIVFAMYFLVCCIFNQFDGIFNAIPVYDYIKDELIIYNLFNYNLVAFISKLPYFIIISLISFAISTITSSTALSICLPLALNIFGGIFNSLVENFKIKWVRWFITYVWNLQPFMIGRDTYYNLNTLKFNLVMIVIYIIVIVVLPYIVFNRKDIKNV